MKKKIEPCSEHREQNEWDKDRSSTNTDLYFYLKLSLCTALTEILCVQKSSNLLLYVNRDVERSTFFSSLTYQNKKGHKKNNKKNNKQNSNTTLYLVSPPQRPLLPYAWHSNRHKGYRH